MQLINTPTLPPGCCFICRAAQRDSYIDTGVSHDYEGAYYICNMCISEMAHMHAYLSFDEYKDVRQAKEEADRLLYEALKRIGELEGIHDALVSAGYRLTDDGSVVVRGGYTSVPHETRTFGAPRAENAVGIGEGEITEQSNDEGMAELHSNEQPTADFDLGF